MGGHPVGTQDEGVAKGRGGEVGEGGRGRGVGVGVGVRGGRGEEKGEVVFAGQDNIQVKIKRVNRGERERTGIVRFPSKTASLIMILIRSPRAERAKHDESPKVAANPAQTGTE
ncbi:hypothetical protein HZH66_007441 [Vespula vulgaris]|uniref:Uncharacterized protein n=1 Tax=Vespula vulgaris TaxID=7454 RepID=A0A834JXP2_VESVU|nr:hypothetical protein HZH66_007441 [Vespula vulgaris]